MTDLREGQQVRVISVGRAPYEAVVLSVTGDDVRVRALDSGRKLCVPRKRIMVDPTPPAVGKLTSTPSYGMGGGTAVPKSAPTRDERYLAFVREKSCCACGAAGPGDAHHWALKGRGHGGMGLKVDDLRTVPLCRGCHDHYHAHGHLPESNTVMTRILFLATQTDLLIEWVKKGEPK